MTGLIQIRVGFFLSHQSDVVSASQQTFKNHMSSMVTLD